MTPATSPAPTRATLRPLRPGGFSAAGWGLRSARGSWRDMVVSSSGPSSVHPALEVTAVCVRGFSTLRRDHSSRRQASLKPTLRLAVRLPVRQVNARADHGWWWAHRSRTWWRRMTTRNSRYDVVAAAIVIIGPATALTTRNPLSDALVNSHVV